MAPLRPAVFLDRDGTLIEDCAYLADPARVRLLPGVAGGLRRLREAGYVCVIVTNQSGIGRGLLTEDDYRRVHDEMMRQLAAEGATIEAAYHCPVAPQTDDPLADEHPDRKPAPGMLLRAAADLGLDLSRSWMIGDAVRDVVAGKRTGCRGCILIASTDRDIPEDMRPDFVAANFAAAVDIVLGTGELSA
jgi:D-glycero-D-manno-heptose 1,7-bisphosphate phosphatase